MSEIPLHGLFWYTFFGQTFKFGGSWGELERGSEKAQALYVSGRPPLLTLFDVRKSGRPRKKAQASDVKKVQKADVRAPALKKAQTSGQPLAPGGLISNSSSSGRVEGDYPPFTVPVICTGAGWIPTVY